MLISIILPCYNSENYIKYIIEDIINQNYLNWELIVVSNGLNQDNQNKIVSEYSNRDKRIKLIKTDKASVSHARNLGIKEARGEWIMFVDSDDRLFDYHIQKYIDILTSFDSKSIDIIISGYWRQTKKLKSPKPLPLKNFVGINYEIISNHYSAIYSPVTKLIKLSTLRQWGGEFNETLTCGEDAVFAFQFLNYTQKVIGFDINGYVYNQTPGSAMSKYHNNYGYALKILTEEMTKLFAKYLSKEDLQRFIYKRFYYNASCEIHNIMQKGSPYTWKQKINQVKNIINNQNLIEALSKIDIEENGFSDKLKIFLIKNKAASILTFLYLICK